MCGGPTGQQKQAATNNLAGGTLASNIASQDASETQPFWSNILQNGIPGFGAQQQYSTSDLAGDINNAKKAEQTKLAGYGGALPSGFASAEDADIGAQGAQAFDQNQLGLLQQQYQAKTNAAQQLNPLNAIQTATGANSSVLNANLSNQFWPNVIGGMLSNAGKSAGTLVNS